MGLMRTVKGMFTDLVRGEPPFEGEHRVYVYDLGPDEKHPGKTNFAATCECGWVEVTFSEEEARAKAQTHSPFVAPRLFYVGDKAEWEQESGIFAHPDDL